MRLIIVMVLACGMVGCSVQPQPIDFGKDACVYCKMNIVDAQHAAEIVTNKGKVFKYDAIECMLKDHENNNAQQTNMFLVCDYLMPGQFIDAETATYLVSEAIPSPMGEYLTAFSTATKAADFVLSDQDKTYTWEEIKTTIHN